MRNPAVVQKPGQDRQGPSDFGDSCSTPYKIVDSKGKAIGSLLVTITVNSPSVNSRKD